MSGVCRIVHFERIPNFLPDSLARAHHSVLLRLASPCSLGKFSTWKQFAPGCVPVFRYRTQREKKWRFKGRRNTTKIKHANYNGPSVTQLYPRQFTALHLERIICHFVLKHMNYVTICWSSRSSISICQK